MTADELKKGHQKTSGLEEFGSGRIQSQADQPQRQVRMERKDLGIRCFGDPEVCLRQNHACQGGSE